MSVNPIGFTVAIECGYSIPSHLALGHDRRTSLSTKPMCNGYIWVDRGVRVRARQDNTEGTDDPEQVSAWYWPPLLLTPRPPRCA